LVVIVGFGVVPAGRDRAPRQTSLSATILRNAAVALLLESRYELR
jgi:hypothetical protein